MKKKLYILTLFQTLIISAFGITVTTTAPNTGVSKVMTVDNGKVYELNFDTDVLSSSKVEVNIKELGSTIASQQISTNGNKALTFTPTSNALTIEFNRINSGTASLQFEVDNIQLKEVVSSKLTHEVGIKNYELSDHLSNVRTSVSDKKVSGSSKVISANDYYPFGMEARSVSNSEYRYGFNTQEKEDEIAQGVYTAEYWKYDSRIARRWNLDPVVVPSHSDYGCFANNPLFYTDHKGDVAVTKRGKEVNVNYKVDEKTNEVSVSYVFQEGTSKRDKKRFLKDNDILFKSLAQTEEGRERIDFLNEVKTKTKIKQSTRIKSLGRTTTKKKDKGVEDEKYGLVPENATIEVNVKFIKEFVNHNIQEEVRKGKTVYPHFNFVDLTEGIGTVFGHETIHIQNSFTHDLHADRGGAHYVGTGMPEYEYNFMAEYRSKFPELGSRKDPMYKRNLHNALTKQILKSKEN